MKTNDKLETEGGLTLMQMMTRFSTEESAREYFENLLWPNGAVCPHCGNNNQERIYKLTANTSRKIRKGLHKCADCNERFTVTMNTVMEDSHIPLNKWLIAFYMMCASKTQISALQLQRHLELGSYRSAWFMCHRIRFTLKDAMPADKLAGTVEADETYIGGRVRGRGHRYVGNKTAVVSLVERSGRVRSTVSLETIKDLKPRADIPNDAIDLGFQPGRIEMPTKRRRHTHINTENRQDAEMAQVRLNEIKESPSKVIKGADLEKRMKQWVS
jgi:transposase-like protein